MGTLAVFAAQMFGALIAFFVGRKCFKKSVQRKLLEPSMYYANAVDRLMQEGNGIEMVFVIRCSPVPNGPLSYMLGGMSVSAKEYVIGTTLIMYVPYDKF